MNGVDLKMRIAGGAEIVVSGKREVRFRPGSRKALIDGRETLMEVPAEIKKGEVLVPLSTVCESLGWTVSRHAESETVYLLPLGQEFHLYARGAEFVLIVTNQWSEPREYCFDSGQTHDFRLKSEGQEVWRYSSGRYWMQMIIQQTLMPGECWVYSAGLDKELPHGIYQLEGYFMGFTNGFAGGDKPAAVIDWNCHETKK